MGTQAMGTRCAREGVVVGEECPPPSGDSNRMDEEPGFYLDHLSSGLMTISHQPALLSLGEELLTKLY